MEEVEDEKTETFSQAHYENLTQIFPEADTSYLKEVCQKYYQQTPRLHGFIRKLIKTRDYPKKIDFQRQSSLLAEQKLYTTEFDVGRYLEIIPDPETFFRNSSRIASLANMDDDYEYALIYLENRFNFICVRTINDILDKELSVVRCNEILSGYPNQLKCKRRPKPYKEETQNIALLQQIAYLEHEKEILNYIEQQNLEKIVKRDTARENGVLIECQCCYDNEILQEESISCEVGHIFCKSCVRRSVEIAFGEGKLDFHCVQQCETQFSLHSLEIVLPSVLFKRIMQKKQAVEVKTAAIDNIEFCPYCDFASIPAEGDRIFRCLNPECLKETCRLCGKPAHIPLRCNEVESDEQVQIRTQIEDRLTEALVRKCYKCNMKFIKEDGCNKMKCVCGATMCYICDEPVDGYQHFNGPGGDKYHLCPLFTNSRKEDARRVLQEARRISTQLEVNNNKALVVNPVKDVEEYYHKKVSRRRRK